MHPVVVIAGFVATTIAIVAAIVAAYSPISVDPHDFESGSYIMPFSIRNNGYISITDANITCGIDVVSYRDGLGKYVSAGQMIPNTDARIAEIKSNESINYLCDAKEVLKTNPDGSITIGNLKTPLQSAALPLVADTMCVWIGVKYKLLGFLPRTYVSQMFEWVKVPTGHFWMRGPLVNEPKTEVTQTCSARPTPPFARLQGPNRPVILQFKF